MIFFFPCHVILLGCVLHRKSLKVKLILNMKNTPPQPVMNFYLLGENAAVMQSRLPVDQQCQRHIWAVAQVLNDEAQCIDVVPGMNNLTAIFDPELQRGDEVIERLKTLWELVEAEQFIPREVRIPVHYGGESGPDLAHVAAHAGMSEEAVIAAHSQAEYIVYFLGFQPGFAYLGGLPAALATPRRAADCGTCRICWYRWSADGYLSIPKPRWLADYWAHRSVFV